jgi:hypothetical protein
MNKIFFIAFLGLLVISCNKQRTFHIKAINAVTGQAYAGLAYSVTATKTAANGEKLVYDHKGFLDANGEAYVTLKVKTGRTYNIGCTKPFNTCYVKNINFTYGQEDEANPTFQFEYAECGYLNFQMENVNCQGPNDQMYYRDRYSYQEWGEFDYPIFGCFVNLNNNFNPVPEGLRIFNWKVVRSGVTTEYIDSLYITAGQNASIFLTY